MKHQLVIVLLTAATVLGSLAFSQNPPAQATPEKRIEKLEGELAATRQHVEALAAELTAANGRLTAVVKYLDAQSKGAAGMSSTLDASEKAGFTYGINPDSRLILLEGWREQLAGIQKGLPAVPPAPVPPAPIPAKSGAER